MKKYARLLALLLAAAMLFALAGCGKGNDTPSNDDENNQGGGDEAKPTTLVVGYDYFSEKFSMFFSKTQYDQDVATMTRVSLLGTDREGNVILNGIKGEDVAYNGTTYHYDGIADCAINTNDDGTVTYDFTMRDDIVFSDGEPMTADDVIFSMYVYCDPTYDGSTTFGSLPIVGLEAYKGGMDTVRNLIAKAGHDGQSEFVSAEDTAAFWAAVDAAGPKFAQSIVDYCINAGYGTDITTAAPNWGYDGVTTVEEFWDAIVKNVGVKEDGSWDFSEEGIDKENAGTSIVDMINAELGDNAAKYDAGVATGESAANVTGIEKTGDYSVRVTLSEFAANAIYQHIPFIAQWDPEYVLVLSGDHIYKMDYNAMLREHIKNGADLTIAVREVPWEEAPRFGILNTDENNRITEFEEKPAQPKSNKASMGVYIFSWSKMRKYLELDEANPNSDNDFGKNIIPAMLEAGENLYTYTFDGYWKDVGTIESLWEANMDLLEMPMPIDLYDKRWRIYARNPGMPPHYIADGAKVVNCLITEGCEVKGIINHSVLFAGVTVETGAEITDAVIMPGAVIERGAVVRRAIVAENAHIGAGAVVGEETGKIAVVGHNAVIPAGDKVAAGVQVDASAQQ